MLTIAPGFQPVTEFSLYEVAPPVKTPSVGLYDQDHGPNPRIVVKWAQVFAKRRYL